MAFPSPKAANGVLHHADSTTGNKQMFVAGDHGYDFRPAVISCDGLLDHGQEHIMPIAHVSYNRAQTAIRHTSTFKWPSTVWSNFLFNMGTGRNWESPVAKFQDVMGRLSNGGGFWRKEQWQTAFHTTEGIYANWADGNNGWKVGAQHIARFNLQIQRIEDGGCVFRWTLTARAGSTAVWMTTAQGYWAHDIKEVEDIRIKLDTPVGTGHYYSEMW